MTSAKELKLEKLLAMTMPIRPFTPKPKKKLCRVRPRIEKTMQIETKESLLEKMIQKILRVWGMFFERARNISQNDERIENLSPKGGEYNLIPNPNPNDSADFRY